MHDTKIGNHYYPLRAIAVTGAVLSILFVLGVVAAAQAKAAPAPVRAHAVAPRSVAVGAWGWVVSPKVAPIPRGGGFPLPSGPRPPIHR